MVQVNLNSAFDGWYNCKTGDCVLMYQRCNGMCDCPDCSDEDQCVVLDKLVNYNPRVLISQTGGKAQVILSAVGGLQGLDETEGTIMVNLEMSIQWSDFRLTFLNLNPDRLVIFIDGHYSVPLTIFGSLSFLTSNIHAFLAMQYQSS